MKNECGTCSNNNNGYCKVAQKGKCENYEGWSPKEQPNKGCSTCKYSYVKCDACNKDFSSWELKEQEQVMGSCYIF